MVFGDTFCLASIEAAFFAQPVSLDAIGRLFEDILFIRFRRRLEFK
jgi:hypothetical protein